MSTLQSDYDAEILRLEQEAARAAEAARLAELARQKSPERLRIEELFRALEGDAAFIAAKGFTLEDRETEVVLRGEHTLITVHVNCQRLQVSKLSVVTIIPNGKAQKRAATEPVSPLQFAMPVGEGDTEWVDSAEEASALIGRYLAQVNFRSDLNA